MKINEIKPIIKNTDDTTDDTNFHDVENQFPESNSDSEEENNTTTIDQTLIKQLKENISKNSIAIADLNISSSNSQTSSTNSQTNSEPTSPTTTNKRNKKKFIFPKYVYANIFNETIGDNNEWTDIKRYQFQKCLWKLKYNRIVSTFYLSDLRRREQRWSWMIIVISTITSGLTIANNVDKEPINHYNTGVNILLTVSSMTTSLIAAWIKKQMFIEKINEIDKYLININSLCEDLDIQLSLLNSDRTSYIDFKKKYIPEITKFLTTNPIIPPIEWKNCIREITVNFPEILNLDNSEDNKLWPWYGDLIFHEDDDKIHTRYPTHFMKYFKRTNKDKLKSSCCGGNKFKSRYNY